MRQCRVNTVHDYNGRSNVFRLVTARRSAYLFEADTTDVMLDWLRAVKLASPNDKQVITNLFIVFFCTSTSVRYDNYEFIKFTVGEHSTVVTLTEKSCYAEN